MKNLRLVILCCFFIFEYSSKCCAQVEIIKTAAGGGGSLGDGGQATAGQLSNNYMIAVDVAGNLYIADQNNDRIRKVNAVTGIITTIAGTGTAGYTGDGIAATASRLNNPVGVAVDASGNVYIGDEGNDRVRKVNGITGIITTIAGTGTGGFSGDGGPATAAQINTPRGVAVDAAGNVYFSDRNNERVRMISVGTNIIRTVAGNGTNGYLGDGVAATTTRINGPRGLWVDGAGNIYLADRNNNRIRRIDGATNIITTVAGTGTAGFLGDGGPATAARVDQAGDVKLDVLGNIYIADVNNNRIRKINSSGIITTIAGSGTAGATAGDWGPATAAAVRTNDLVSIAILANPNYFYISDQGNNRIRLVKPNSVPFFTGGTSLTFTVCQNSIGNSLNSLLPVMDSDRVQTLTWSVVTTATHGTLVGSATATANGGIVTPAGLSYTPTPGYTGPDNFTIQISDGYNTSTTTVNVSVDPVPVVAPISGTGNVCVGSNITLTDATPSGVWSASNGNAIVSGGVVTGVSAGNVTISYAVTNACGTSFVTHPVTVDPAPSAPAVISGPSAVCTGSTISLTDATPGGIWSSSAPGTASVGSLAGSVTGISGGTVIITYTTSNACGAVFVTKSVTVNTTPVTISGSAVVCVGASNTLTSAPGGGTWSSTNMAAATIGSSTGIVIGVAAGTTTISYVLIGGCATALSVTVNAAPNAGTITGLTTTCVGFPVTLTDAASGGVWSSSNPAVAVVGSTGIVTGVSVGSTTISYTVTNGCGTATATSPMSVSAGVSPGSISGPATLCAGTYAVLTETETGGVWSVTNSTASIASSGLLTAISPGIDTVLYTVTSACGAVSAMHFVTIGPFLSAGTITGAGAVCEGASISLSDATPGGVWSASNANATVSGGVVTGVSAGVVVVSYTVTSSCGSAFAVATVFVNPLPDAGVITGPAAVCVGGTITLADAASGGAWSASNANATVSGGLVTGISVGTVDISYTVTNGCGTASATSLLTIGSAPFAGVITGPANVCVGASIALSDAVPGGTWSADNANATVTSGGLVTGVAAGTDIITYTVTTSCGTATATSIINIDPLPDAGLISGPTNVCVGATITLTDAAPGGIWSASNTNATVSGGIVTGVAAGTVDISYSVTSVCGTTSAVSTITIDPAPDAGTITGVPNVCVGAAITLTDATPGGVWSASNTNATVSGGIVTGVAAGTVDISYSVTSVCGTTSAVSTITIDPAPDAGTITGVLNVCVGAITTLTDAAPGGVWSASNGNATVAGGIVTGVAEGMDTISYTVTNTCGTAIAFETVNITTVPMVTAISGPTAVCKTGSITLTEATSGGVWSASNARATVNPTGVVTGITVGVDTIMYTVSNACGTTSVTKVISIIQAPSPGTILGESSVCAGYSIVLTDWTTGGIWSSSNSSVATVSVTGTVSGVAIGAATISYTKTNGCGSRSATKSVTVLPHSDCSGSSSGVSNVNGFHNELKVYPNPNKGIFSIHLVTENDQPVTITITNIIGKKVKEFTTTTNKVAEVQLNTAPGIYLLIATTGNERYINKVTVE